MDITFDGLVKEVKDAGFGHQEDLDFIKAAARKSWREWAKAAFPAYAEMIDGLTDTEVDSIRQQVHS